MLTVDHLMLGVADVSEAIVRWEDERGLRTMGGVTFDSAPAFGNEIVPLGDTWVELFGVVDDEAAEHDPLGASFRQALGLPERLLGWALVPPDLDAVARRLGLEVRDERATDADGGEPWLWRAAGFSETRSAPYLPFFLQWRSPAVERSRTGTARVGNPQADVASIRLELSGEPDRLAEWLGDLEAPCSIVPGPPGLRARMRTTAGELVVG